MKMKKLTEMAAAIYANDWILIQYLAWILDAAPVKKSDTPIFLVKLAKAFDEGDQADCLCFDWVLSIDRSMNTI